MRQPALQEPAEQNLPVAHAAPSFPLDQVVVDTAGVQMWQRLVGLDSSLRYEVPPMVQPGGGGRSDATSTPRGTSGAVSGPGSITSSGGLSVGASGGVSVTASLRETRAASAGDPRSSGDLARASTAVEVSRANATSTPVIPPCRESTAMIALPSTAAPYSDEASGFSCLRSIQPPTAPADNAATRTIIFMAMDSLPISNTTGEAWPCRG